MNFFLQHIYQRIKRIRFHRSEILLSHFKVPPLSPGPQRQPSVGNVLARTSSFGSAVGPLLPRQPSSGSNNGSPTLSRQATTGNGVQRHYSPSSNVPRQNSGGSAGSSVTRQGSQGSLFEQFASQAKDLVRETTRQSSQDGLLAHMDKVSRNENEFRETSSDLRKIFSIIHLF